MSTELDRGAVQAFAEFVGVSRDQQDELLRAVVDGVRGAADSVGLGSTIDRNGILWIFYREWDYSSPPSVGVASIHGHPPAIRLTWPGNDQQPEELEIPLRFDHITRQMTGVERDTSIAPVPGEPIPYRSAVATVAEKVVERLRAQVGK